MKKLTKGDKILIVIIVIISIVSLIFVNISVFSYQEKFISVQVNGKEIKKIIFDSSLIGETVPIETEYGYNLIEIGDEKVRVIEADCPDQLDVKQGYISNVGEVIVCLPNRLVIEIKGMDEVEIDRISR
ncbi:NusG domain II-containing protein [Schnuerera sp. xch1]|uniref:NusG domain II-containing protein n=1 Tax=Schnuerera sp. xch1 TaxID=2874283 RepID=UPI001CBDD267|nr:NusG domain II-containing protein [Schnuerera sp. xch1]